MKIINPSNNEVIKEILEDTKESVLDKLKKLKVAQKSWAKTKLEDRLAIIQKFGEIVSERKEELAQILYHV